MLAIRVVGFPLLSSPHPTIQICLVKHLEAVLALESGLGCIMMSTIHLLPSSKLSLGLASCRLARVFSSLPRPSSSSRLTCPPSFTLSAAPLPYSIRFTFISRPGRPLLSHGPAAVDPGHPYAGCRRSDEHRHHHRPRARCALPRRRPQADGPPQREERRDAASRKPGQYPSPTKSSRWRFLIRAGRSLTSSSWAAQPSIQASPPLALRIALSTSNSRRPLPSPWPS